jgi:hypothetical protein
VKFLIIIFLISCVGERLKSSYSDLYINRHELIGVSYTDRELESYNLRSGLQKSITKLSRTSDTAKGSVWLNDTFELAVALDGKDRIIAINAVDGTTRDLIVDGNLNGVLRSMTRLDDGDLLIIESNNIERFSIDGLRRTSGWPLNVASANQIRNLSTGNFVLCAGGAVDQVRIYDIDGNLLYSHSGPGGTDARGCEELSDGRIVVSWSGITDQIWVYNSDLTGGSVLVDNLDISIMPSPNSLAIDRDDNIFITDTTYNYVIKFDSQGNFKKSFGSFSNSQDIYIVP